MSIFGSKKKNKKTQNNNLQNNKMMAFKIYKVHAFKRKVIKFRKL